MKYSSAQIFILVLLRVAIGWQLLFEGVTKILNPAWSAKNYLLESKGFLSGFYEWIANNNSILDTVNVINEWGLTIIGLFLILGFLSRISSIAGAVFILMFYFSHPALIGVEYMFPTEGTNFIVNKNIIEFFALLVLFVFPTGQIIGIDRFMQRQKYN